MEATASKILVELQKGEVEDICVHEVHDVPVNHFENYSTDPRLVSRVVLWSGEGDMEYQIPQAC